MTENRGGTICEEKFDGRQRIWEYFCFLSAVSFVLPAANPEQVGLITPEYTDPDSGCRYYGARQFEVLNSIRYLRTLDMHLEEIADFLSDRDVERMKEKLRSQKETVLAKQEELRRMASASAAFLGKIP